MFFLGQALGASKARFQPYSGMKSIKLIMYLTGCAGPTPRNVFTDQTMSVMVKFHVQMRQGIMEKKMYKCIVICLLLICSGSVMAEKEEKQYLCVSKVAGGFSFNNEAKTWKGTGVDVNGTEKYLVKLNDKRYPKATATVTPFGEDNPAYQCGSGNKKLGSTHACHAVYGQFFFNQKSLRYLLSSMGGYIDGKDESTDYFPFIEGGTCSPL